MRKGSRLLLAFMEYKSSMSRLQKAVSWLVRNNLDGPVDEQKFPNGFAHPDYMGMPKEIYSKLSSDEVDWVQTYIQLDEPSTPADLPGYVWEKK